MLRRDYLKEIIENKQKQEQEYKEFLKETHKQMSDNNFYWFATRENYCKVMKIKKYLEENNMMTNTTRNFFKQAYICKKRGKLDEYIAFSKSLVK